MNLNVLNVVSSPSHQRHSMHHVLYSEAVKRLPSEFHLESVSRPFFAFLTPCCLDFQSGLAILMGDCQLLLCFLQYVLTIHSTQLFCPTMWEMQQNQYENLNQTFAFPSLKTGMQISFNFEFLTHITDVSSTYCKCSHMKDLYFCKLVVLFYIKMYLLTTVS